MSKKSVMVCDCLSCGEAFLVEDNMLLCEDCDHEPVTSNPCGDDVDDSDMFYRIY
jgi:hypothetical protein